MGETARDFDRTRELHQNKRPVQQPKKKMMLEVSCTNMDCRYYYMVETDAADYPKTVKCKKCGGQSDVERIR